MNNANPTVPTVLECKGIHKEYIEVDTPLKILMDINFKVAKAEQVAIMGRSGSGKTTLLQVLGMLDKPTQGDLFINGHNMQNLNEPERARIRNQSLGFIYQFHHLLPEFSALENVAMPLLIAKVAPAKASLRAAELLDQVGLKDRLQHRPSELSGGERQRVAIARALVNTPDCVLADEPTGNLDDETALQIFDVLQQINQTLKTSIILVTHDAALAKRLDRTLVLHGGQLAPST